MKMRMLVALLATAGSVMAGWSIAADKNSVDLGEMLKSGAIMPLDAVIQKVTAQHPGKITEIELNQERGGAVYELDILDDKGVKTEYKVDAKSGEVLSSKLDKDDKAEGKADEAQAKNDSQGKDSTKKDDDDDDDDD